VYLVQAFGKPTCRRFPTAGKWKFPPKPFAHLGTKGVRHSENAYENMEVNPNFGMKKMPQTFQNSRRNLGEVKVPKMCSF